MPSPKHLQEPLRRTTRQRVFLVLGTLATMLLFSGAAGLGYLNYKFGQIRRFDVAIDVAPLAGEPRNYLLVGSDTRQGLDPNDPFEAQFFEEDGSAPSGDVQRTDTIMILRVDPETGSAYLLSLPRDLFVRIAGRGDRNRINVAFTRGREVLVDTIRENFDIPIHHYVEVNFVGFLGLVDAIGGVPMYFSSPLRDDFSQLHVDEPGCINLNGAQALAFARSRHLEIQDPETGRWRADPTGDLGRISRQQEFIRRSIARAVSKGLTNPVTLNELVNVGVQFVGLDPTLTVSDILALGRRFASFQADTLQTYSIPATPFRTSAGASVLDLDERGAEPIFNIFRGIDPNEVTPGLVEVTVLNGVGTEGLAGDVTTALAAVGFGTGTPGDTVEHFAETTIFYAEGSEAYATRVARHVTGPVTFAIDEDLELGSVVLVVGDDFTTVHDQPSPTVPELPTTTTTTTAPPSTDGGTVATTVPPSTTSTTEPVGYLPGEAPPGVSCG